MPSDWRKGFDDERARLNTIVSAGGHLGVKRFFALDEQAYHAGVLPAATKELLGLVASMVLRCNDCIACHLTRCVDGGATKNELYEAFNVALVVGGSIVIPHLRFAAEKLESLLGPR
ncbi:MAG TPA: carboxymuconolactone decarboxylase family protein [Patescibacteria group bacterium]|nr:carboxymuconolactone decarboxylase family protein [Patescibacteria group bacterium]